MPPESEANKRIQLEKQQVLLKQQQEAYKNLSREGKTAVQFEKQRLAQMQDIVKTEQKLKKIKEETNKEAKAAIKDMDKVNGYQKDQLIKLQKLTGRLNKNNELYTDIKSSSQVASEAMSEQGAYSKINSNTAGEIADYAKEVSNLQIQALENEKNIGTEKFKSSDLDALSKKRQELENARLESKIDFRTKEGKLIRDDLELLDAIIGKETARVEVQKEQHELTTDTTKKAEEMLDNFVDKAKKLPGGGFLLKSMGMGPDDLPKIKENLGKAFGTITGGDLKGGLKEIKGAFGNVNMAILGGVVAMLALVAIFKKLNDMHKVFAETQDEVGKTFGAMGLQKYGQQFQGIFAGTAQFAVDTARAAEGINKLTHGYGMSFQKAIDLVGATTDLSYALGMSQGETAGLIGQLSTATGLSEEGAIQLAKQGEMLAVANKKAPAAVMKEVANNTEFFAKYSKDGGANIIEAAVQAGKLGVGLDKVADVMGGLLDFETSLTNEMEASIMLGRTLNLQKARELALNNDNVGAMKEVVKQVGSEAEWNRLNAFQRESLAKALNMSVPDMAKFVEKGKEGAEVAGDISDQDWTKLVGDDALSGITKFSNAMDGMGKIFAASVGPMLGMMAEGFAYVATAVAESSIAMGTLKALMSAAIPIMIVFAIKSVVVAVSKIWEAVGKMSAVTGGWGMAAAVIGGMAAVASIYQSVGQANAGGYAAFNKGNFATNGPTNLTVGEGGRPEHVQVTEAAPGGKSMQTVFMAQYATTMNKMASNIDRLNQNMTEQSDRQIKSIEAAAITSGDRAGQRIHRAGTGGGI